MAKFKKNHKNEYLYEEISKFFNVADNHRYPAIIIRCLVLMDYYSGYTLEKIAKHHGVSLSYISWLHLRFEREGLKGVFSRIPRYPQVLQPQQKDEVIEHLQSSNCWASEEVINLIKERFTIDYSQSRTPVSRLLNIAGFSYQRRGKVWIRKTE